MHSGKEEVKCVLFEDSMIIYGKKKSIDSIKKVSELINKFNKITGYKINSQESTAFLYSSNKQSKIEIIKNTISSNSIKFIGINLTWMCKTYALKTTK